MFHNNERLGFLLHPALIAGLFLFAVGGVMGVQAQAAGDLVIAEIGADPASAVITTAEPHAEYFVICNRSATNYDLNGWMVTDSAPSTLTLPIIILRANSCVSIVNSTTVPATNVFSPAPLGYGCASVPLNAVLITTGWFGGNLGNAGERLGLFTPANALIDGVSYGTDIFYLNPAAPDPFNNSGATLIRTGYPTAPASLPDTDTNADFTSRASGTPCDAPLAPSAANVEVSGRVLTPNGRGLRNGIVTLTDSRGATREARSSSFGYYRFEDVRVGETYVIDVNSKRYIFTPSTVQVFDAVSGLDMTADGER